MEDKDVKLIETSLVEAIFNRTHELRNFFRNSASENFMIFILDLVILLFVLFTLFYQLWQKFSNSFKKTNQSFK